MGFAVDAIKNEFRKGVVAELKKDRNKDGHPDALQALEKVDEGLDAAAELLGFLGESDYLRGLQFLNAAVGHKVPADKLPKYAKALAGLPEGIRFLDTFVEKGEELIKEQK